MGIILRKPSVGATEKPVIVSRDFSRNTSVPTSLIGTMFSKGTAVVLGSNKLSFSSDEGATWTSMVAASTATKLNDALPSGYDNYLDGGTNLWNTDLAYIWGAQSDAKIFCFATTSNFFSTFRRFSSSGTSLGVFESPLYVGNHGFLTTGGTFIFGFSAGDTKTYKTSDGSLLESASLGSIESLCELSDGTCLIVTSNGLYTSSNFGDSWSALPTPSLKAHLLPLSGKTVIMKDASTNALISSNKGQSWSSYTAPSGYVRSQIRLGENHFLWAIYDSSSSGSVIETKDNGLTWETVKSFSEYVAGAIHFGEGKVLIACKYTAHANF